MIDGRYLQVNKMIKINSSKSSTQNLPVARHFKLVPGPEGAALVAAQIGHVGGRGGRGRRGRGPAGGRRRWGRPLLLLPQRWTGEVARYVGLGETLRNGGLLG